MTRRGGFTLVEVAMGLALLGLVSAVYVAVILAAARPALRAWNGAMRDRTVGTLSTFLARQLRDARVDDITASVTRVSMSRSIGDGLACADSGSAIFIADTAYAGVRAPQGGRDVITLLANGDSLWQVVTLDSVRPARCPGTGAPALRLDVASHAGAAMAVRVLEPVELSVYRSGVSDWYGLGPADHSSSVQPFAGPLLPGASVFQLRGRALEATVVPLGGPATTVSVPVGPVP